MSSTTNGDETRLISADGYAKLSSELDRLRDEARRELAGRLREARDDGDLDDNPALQDLFEEKAQLERRIALLELQLANVEIVSPSTDGRAGIGSLVRIRDAGGATQEFELVGALEADIDAGRVSIDAPVGQAVLGLRAGGRAEVATPGGRLVLQVLSVRPSGARARAAA